MAIWTTEGIKDKLRFLVGLDTDYSLSAVLFTNDFVPSVLTTWPDLVECPLPGYVRIPLLGTDWTVSAASGVATGTYPTLTWTFTANGGGVTVYGYAVIDTTTGRTAFVERFAAPYLVPGAGGSLTVQLTWYDQGL